MKPGKIQTSELSGEQSTNPGFACRPFVREYREIQAASGSWFLGF
jgi:hypothetical protein